MKTSILHTEATIDSSLWEMATLRLRLTRIETLYGTLTILLSVHRRYPHCISKVGRLSYK
jgi:hypothetical protein